MQFNGLCRYAECFYGECRGAETLVSDLYYKTFLRQ